jgi:hypothetical protein
MPTPVSTEAIAKVRLCFPWLRDDYFQYLAKVGWGETDAGRTSYSGPIAPTEIYGHRDHLSHIVLLGDDSQGYCFAYCSEMKCYGEVSGDGTWEPWSRVKGIHD